MPAQRLVGEELDRRHADLDAARREPDDDAVPPGRSASHASRIVSGAADHLERVVDAAARERRGTVRGRVAVAIDDVGRAPLARASSSFSGPGRRR